VFAGDSILWSSRMSLHVIPAQAGIQVGRLGRRALDSRFRGHRFSRTVSVVCTACRPGMNSRAESWKSPLKGTPRPQFAVGPSTVLRTCFSRLGATQPGNSFPGDGCSTRLAFIDSLFSRE